MPKPLFVFTADNHLRPFTWAKHPDLWGDAYFAWQFIVDFCLTHGLRLWQLGDLYDKTRPDSYSVSIYLYHVARLQAAGLPFWYLEGNHDIADPPWASLSPWARPISVMSLEGVDIAGFSYAPSREILADRLSKLPDADVVMTHQSWEEVQRVGHTDGSFSMFPRGTVLLTGDYHVCGQYTGLAANGETVTAYSPGSTVMQALNEAPDKYFGVLNDDLSVTWVQIPTRPYAAYEAVVEVELDSILRSIRTTPPLADQRLPEPLRKPILHVKYNDAIPEAARRLEEAAGDAYHLFLVPQYHVLTQVIDVEATPAGSFDDLKSSVGLCTPPGQPVYNGLMRLLDSSDAPRELNLMFEEFTADAPAGTTTAAPV